MDEKQAEKIIRKSEETKQKNVANEFNEFIKQMSAKYGYVPEPYSYITNGLIMSGWRIAISRNRDNDIEE